MPSPHNSFRSRKNYLDDDDDEDLSELEAQRKEAGEIVQKWFRFRARRGLGVFYSLLAFLSILGSILWTVFNSENAMIVGVSIAVVCVWAVSRMAGMQSFYKMSNTIGLLRENGGGHAQDNRRAFVIFLSTALWPWFAYVIAGYFGLPLYQVFFAVVWLLELSLYRIYTFRRNKYPVISYRIEDWLVVFFVPFGAILSALQLIPNGSPFFGFFFVSPVMLFCGIKSLYDAPKELVRDLDAEQE